MTERDDTAPADSNSTHRKRERVAEAFGTEVDPLAEYVSTCESLDIDPLQLFLEEVIYERGLSDSRVDDYERIYDQYRQFMQTKQRPPACPTSEHIRDFAVHQLEKRGKKVQQVKANLRLIERAYEYWQNGNEWPHPEDYNPIDLGRQKVGFKAYRDEEKEDEKEVRILSVSEISNKIRSVKNIRDQTIIGSQFKLFARVGAVTEMRLCDITIQHPDLQAHYSELGSHPRLADYENAVIIPDNTARARNKSANPRVLPIDDELRRLLIRYLLIRPDADEPYVFLSQERNDQLWPKRVNQMWKSAFHPEFAETDLYKPITSHYGRHFATTYWRINQEVPREKVKYMRGDELDDDEDQNDSIDTYIHSQYEDIEEVYRENVFKFGLGF